MHCVHNNAKFFSLMVYFTPGSVEVGWDWDWRILLVLPCLTVHLSLCPPIHKLKHICLIDFLVCLMESLEILKHVSPVIWRCGAIFIIYEITVMPLEHHDIWNHQQCDYFSLRIKRRPSALGHQKWSRVSKISCRASKFFFFFIFKNFHRWVSGQQVLKP